MPIPQQRDPDETSRKLAAWLARRMPGAAHIEVLDLTPPSATGYSNDTLLFDLRWDEAGRERREGKVVRIRPSGHTVFPEYDLRRQYTVMKILGERTDIPVPPVSWFEEDEGILGAPFFLMGKVEGRIPGDNPPYHVAGWVTEISPQERASLWWDGIEVLARIHRLDWEELGLGFFDDPRRGARGLAQQLHFYTEYLAWAARGKSQPLAEAALSWLRARLPADEPVGLCWGDARIGNMIFVDGKCRAVLDWEMAALGNPEQDLAWWLFLDRHHSEGVMCERLPGFPSREDTVARYESLVGRRVRHLEFYEMFAAFRFAVIMIRLAQMLIAYEVLPPDSDLESNNIVTQLLAKMLATAA